MLATLSTIDRRRTLLALLVVIPLAGCVGAPDGVEPVTGFELDRFLGTWYELARLDHSFERGLTDVTAHYATRQEGGIHVVNRGYDPAEGQWQEANGKAFFVGEPSTGALKVSFFGPFYGGYNVIALDQDAYQWVMVAGPNRSFLWIMARTPALDAAIVDRLIAEAEALGFPTAELIRVPHARSDVPTPAPSDG